MFILGLGGAVTLAAQSQQPPPAAFQIEEATIAQIHAAMKAGRLTCRGLVEQYLRRIEAYDKNGPALNAIVVDQSRRAERRPTCSIALQARRARVGPLHCIPTIVKDNFETIGLQSADGSLALKGFVSSQGRVPGEAHQRGRRDRPGEVEHGGVGVHAVRNRELDSARLHEESVRARSRHGRIERRHRGGRGRELRRGRLGSDTGNSIRGPASHQALAGIRSTMGLTSRGGVVPLNLLADIAGPMARTLEDAVAVFQVIVGEDPDDPVTIAGSRSRAGFSPRPAGHCPELRAGARARRAEGRAHRRAAPGLRARHDRSGDRAGLHGGRRRPAAAGAVDRRSRRGRGSTTSGARRAPDRAADSSTTSIAICGATASACRCTTSRRSSSRAGSIRPCSGASSRRRKAPRTARTRRRARRKRSIASRCAPRCLKTMDAAEAGRVRLSDLEQPAAADRRPEHAARRQQPVLLADDRLPGDQRADGLHARGHLPAGITFFGRAWDEAAHQARVRVRTSDPPSPSAAPLALRLTSIPRLSTISYLDYRHSSGGRRRRMRASSCSIDAEISDVPNSLSPAVRDGGCGIRLRPGDEIPRAAQHEERPARSSGHVELQYRACRCNGRPRSATRSSSRKKNSTNSGPRSEMGWACCVEVRSRGEPSASTGLTTRRPSTICARR